MIEVTGLTKKVTDSSGELTILNDIHFTVRSGATLALMGASGSGKSTLLGLLAGLDTPSSGHMLSRVSLSQRLNHYPKFMSGGEQQRVALARAFVTEPKLLLADEPTGSLDAATGEAVIDLMFGLNREQGSTLVLVTHDPAIAARCSRTLTIAAGRVVADTLQVRSS